MAKFTKEEQDFWDNFKTNFPAYADQKDSMMADALANKELEDDLDSLFGDDEGLEGFLTAIRA